MVVDRLDRKSITVGFHKSSQIGRTMRKHPHSITKISCYFHRGRNDGAVARELNQHKNTLVHYANYDSKSRSLRTHAPRLRGHLSAILFWRLRKTGTTAVATSPNTQSHCPNVLQDLPIAAVHTGSPVPGHSILRSYPIFSPPPDYGRATRSRLDHQPARNSRTEASSVG